MEDKAQWCTSHTQQNGVGTLRMTWHSLHPSYTAVGLDAVTPENSLAAPAEDTHTPWPSSPTPGFTSHKKTYIGIFIAGLFVVAPDWKQTKSSPTWEKKKKKKSTEIRSYHQIDWWRMETAQKNDCYVGPHGKSQKRNEWQRQNVVDITWFHLCILQDRQKQPMVLKIAVVFIVAAAAKSFQSCPTPCDSIDGSPPGSPVPGILQVRTLEWVAVSSSNAWKWKMKVKLLSRIQPLATPWTAAHQPPPSIGFSRQEYWSGVPLPSPSIYPWRVVNGGRL